MLIGINMDESNNRYPEDTNRYPEDTKAKIWEEKERERKSRILEEYTNTEDYRSRLETRAKIFDACLDGRKEYILSRARVIELCKGIQEDGTYDNATGIIFFIDNFGWSLANKIVVDKEMSKHLPFLLFDIQKDAIKWLVDGIDNGHDCFLEKSRDMGASWVLFVYVSLWYWLFKDGVNILLGSYKEMLVDDGTIDSLFGKAEYAIHSLPRWLLPRNFNMGRDRTMKKLIRRDNGNVITGDTMNPNFGRGSRKTAIFFDELGHWDYAKSAWESSGESTNCRFANSTPNGMNYYGMLRETGINKFTMHWHDHPLKDQDWYDYECFRNTPEAVAQEIDISYTKSLEGKVYPDWNEINIEQGQFKYDSNLPLYVGWDFGKTDDTAMIWAQPNRGKLRIIDTYSNHGKIIDFYVPFITGVTDSGIHKYTSRDLEKIAEHKYWKAGIHFGDPAGRFVNNVIDKTVFDILKDNGIHVNFQDDWKHFKIRKEVTRQLILNGIELNMNEDTKWFNNCMLNAAYSKVKREGIEFTVSDKPRHDSTSHFRSAMEYLSLGLKGKYNHKREVRDKFVKGERFTKRRVVGY